MRADGCEAFKVAVLQQAHDGRGGRQLQRVRPLPVGQQGGAAVLIHECQCNARDSCGAESETASISTAPRTLPQCLPTPCRPTAGTIMSPLELHSVTWQAGPTGGEAARGAEPSCALWGAKVRSMGFCTGCPHHSKNLSPVESQQIPPCPAGASWVVQHTCKRKVSPFEPGEPLCRLIQGRAHHSCPLTGQSTGPRHSSAAPSRLQRM